MKLTIGVLALQGAFIEHLQLLCRAAERLATRDNSTTEWTFTDVRTPEQLSKCDALIIPGGESTTMSLVSARSNLLEPLRTFVKVHRKPTWGTCAGLILLAESANKTKQGGQELIGGLDVRVNRNHFGRQTESFLTTLTLPFLSDNPSDQTFKAVFIRAPVVEKILPFSECAQIGEQQREETVIAPSRHADQVVSKDVEVLATLRGRTKGLEEKGIHVENVDHAGDIVAVRQGNCFGTSFHPELTADTRIHEWWLVEVERVMKTRA